MSRSLNKVMLIGNVGNDPEIRATSGGTRVAKISLATNRSWPDRSGQQQEKTEWHRLTVFGRLVDVVVQALVYGDLRAAPKCVLLAAGGLKSREAIPPPYTLPRSGAPRTDFSGGASNHLITRPVLPSTRTRLFPLPLGPEKMPAISTSPP